MTRWVILLRGINVGGKNRLPMAELRALLSGLGYHDVQSYIQSGNCLLSSTISDKAAIEQSIQSAIQAAYDFSPQVFALSVGTLEQAYQNNPYRVDDESGAQVHFYFLSTAAPNPDPAALDALRAESEAFTLTDTVFYLYAPQGAGRSKLAAGAGRKLGVPVTARNLRTIKKLLSMAGVLES